MKRSSDDPDGPAPRAKSTKVITSAETWVANRKLDYVSPIPGLVPANMISMMSGASGVGKTAYLAGFLKRVLDKKPVFGATPVEIPFIGLVVTDRCWNAARFWFDKAGVVEGERFQARCLLDNPEFDWVRAKKESEHAALFEEILDALGAPPGSFVIFDPIALYLGRHLNDYSETAVMLGQLNAVCIRRRITVLGVCHTKKAVKDPKDAVLRAQDRTLGSTAIASYSNTQFYVIGPEETKKSHYLIGVVSHEAPPVELPFVRGADGLFVPLTQEEREKLAADEVAESLDLDPVYPLLPGPGEEPMPAKRIVEIASMKNISRPTIYRKLKTWKDGGFVETPTEGYWRRSDPQKRN